MRSTVLRLSVKIVLVTRTCSHTVQAFHWHIQYLLRSLLRTPNPLLAAQISQCCNIFSYSKDPAGHCVRSSSVHHMVLCHYVEVIAKGWWCGKPWVIWCWLYFSQPTRKWRKPTPSGREEFLMLSLKWLNFFLFFFLFLWVWSWTRKKQDFRYTIQHFALLGSQEREPWATLDLTVRTVT